MTIIEIPDDEAASLKARAAAQGLTLTQWLERLARETGASREPQPLKTGRGMLANYGAAPSNEDIDQNRREMFRAFAKDR